MTKKQEKSELRRFFRDERKALSESYRFEAGLRAIPHLLKCFGAFDIKATEDVIVAGYAAYGCEIDCHPALAILGKLGFRTALPRIASPEAGLTFHLYDEKTPLIPNALGIAEPDGVSPLVTPTVILCPALAVDGKGGRLGQGGGYYDRTLAVSSALCIGFIFSAQFSQAGIPTEPHDIPLDAVICENFYKFF